MQKRYKFNAKAVLINTKNGLLFHSTAKPQYME